MDFLNDMALFVEVAKVMSFRQAAEKAGVPSSTLSRRISALEKAIGLRLLHRTTRKIELTEAGQIYYQRCRRIVEEARLAHDQLTAMLEQPSGVIRASLPVDFATQFLTPLFAEFTTVYPQIRFELDLTPRTVDLVTEPFDIAIRIGRLPDSQLIARQLTQFNARLYASPNYLARSGTPATPQDLVQHECIDFPKSGTWTLHSQAATLEIAVQGRFVANSVDMIRRLALLDQGIVFLPAAVVVKDVAQGKLQPLLPDWQGSSVPVYALTETRLLPAKTQRFIEFLQARLGSSGKQPPTFTL
ncbi:MAG: LysR family transcriptional regulator [Thiothrix sp.]|nr:MAG: LysR family transcriptional regulator [Thiothrix sp.]